MDNLRLIKQLFFFTILLNINFRGLTQEISNDESELYDLIMKYRSYKGLPAIPVSISLTLVAHAHANDLEENYIPNQKCNLHTWSNSGNWKPVCYTNDHAQAKLMWSKPQELTSYKGEGFEIVFAEDEKYLANAGNALDTWKLSKQHNAIILNKGMWKKKWNAIGIAIVGSYAVVWFGNELDN